MTWQLSHFDFDLPEELIAIYPRKERTASRLLTLDGCSGKVEHRLFKDLLSFLKQGDLLIANNTKVIPARLHGHKKTGGKVQILITKIVDDKCAWAYVKASRSSSLKTIYIEDITCNVIDKSEGQFLLQFDVSNVLELLERIGKMPIPPYLKRDPEPTDDIRYQTVFGNKQGAIAAPTAGLHFDRDFIDAIIEKGITIKFITLHVGIGTFKKVQCENIQDHVMHSEYIEVTKDVVNTINEAKKNNQRVIAVGTTSVRALETVANFGLPLKPFKGFTDIFIYPGYDFRIVDALITNFHLPQSSLLMLVSAFGGYKNIMNAYYIALKEKYRFFSYGDAMFITKNPKAHLEIFPLKV